MGSFPTVIPYPRLRRRPSDIDPYESDAWAADAPSAPVTRLSSAGADPYESTPESEAIVRDRGAEAWDRADKAISRMSPPPDVIGAEGNPVNSRLRMPNPDFVGTYDRTSRTDPNLQRASMARQGVSPDEYAALHTDFGPAPVRPVRNEHPHRGGILGELKNIGKGALLGMGMTGGAGGAGGALGGALVGAIAGGASPKALENADYTYNRMPRYQHEAELYNKELGQREVLADRIGNRVGFDPISGAETPGHEDRRLNRDIHRMQVEETTTNQELNRTEREKKDREQVAATAVERAALMRQPVPIASVRGTSLEAWGGQTPPPKPTAAPHFDATGKAVWDSTQGKWVQAPGAEVIPDKPDAGAAGRAQSERHWQEGNRRQDQKEAEARQEKANVAVTTFNNAKKEAERAAKEYRETLLSSQRQHVEGAAKGEHITSPEKLAELEAKVKSSKEAMLNAHRAVADNFGDQYETGADAKGNPYVKPKEGGPKGRGSLAAGGPGTVPVITKANAAKAAARRGVTLEKFIEDFEGNGGTIIP
jgi:hypothetical protein